MWTHLLTVIEVVIVLFRSRTRLKVRLLHYLSLVLVAHILHLVLIS